LGDEAAVVAVEARHLPFAQRLKEGVEHA
jgi:hypothetical protein